MFEDDIILREKIQEDKVRITAENKKERLKTVLSDMKKLLNATNFAIELLDFAPFDYQNAILLDKSPIIVANCGRQVGKTTIAAVKALHYAFTHAKKNVLIIAPTQRQSTNLFRKIKLFLNKYLDPSVVRSTQTELELTNGSMIVSLPSGVEGEGIRGYTAHLLIIDEAAYVPDAVFAAVTPMLATTRGQIMLLSTPRGKRGFFYEIWLSAKEDSNISKYHLPSITSPLITKDFLESQREKVTDFEFRAEYLAEFVSEMGAYFSVQVIESCIRDYEYSIKGREDRAYFMGIDWGKYDDSTVVAVVERGDVFHRVVAMKEFPKKQYGEVINYIGRMKERFNILRCYADRGSGERQIEEIKAMGISIVGLFFTIRSRIDIYQNLLFMMEENLVIFPEDKKLIRQLTDFEYSFSPSGNLVFKKIRKLNDDYVDALALACFNLKRPYRPLVFKGITAKI